MAGQTQSNDLSKPTANLQEFYDIPNITIYSHCILCEYLRNLYIYNHKLCNTIFICQPSPKMKQIIESLTALKGKEIEPNLIRQTLHATNLKKIVDDEEINALIPDKYHRRMVMDDPIQVFLMTWPPQFFYPIHQHNNFWGFVIPVRGVLSETIYGYAPNKRKVYIHPTKTFNKGELIYEPYNVIHKLQNASPIDSLVTLHIYYPPGYNFKGTSIFDAKNRRLAVLNEKAENLSWDLPADHYALITEDAYDLEKLW